MLRLCRVASRTNARVKISPRSSHVSKVAQQQRWAQTTSHKAKLPSPSSRSCGPGRFNSFLQQNKLSKNALALRFSNENSYLNWARNGVLSSAVGVAMYAQEHHRGAQLSGAGLLVLALGYIGVGTLKYIYYVVRFRQRMEMSLMTLTFTIGHATGALGIWLMATACFLEWIPLSLDYVLLTDPIADYLPRRIRQGLIETYRLHLEDETYLNEEEQHILEAIKIAREKKQKAPSITVRA